MSSQIRPSKEQTFMEIAEAWAKQSTCSKKIRVGAVLVNKFNQVIASGYNGSPRSLPHCDEVGCDDDGHTHRVIHAEENAILHCALNGTASRGSILYVTHVPCLRCCARIIQAGIVAVVWQNIYGNYQPSIDLLKSVGISVRRVNETN